MGNEKGKRTDATVLVLPLFGGKLQSINLVVNGQEYNLATVACRKCSKRCGRQTFLLPTEEERCSSCVEDVAKLVEGAVSKAVEILKAEQKGG